MIALREETGNGTAAENEDHEHGRHGHQDGPKESKGNEDRGHGNAEERSDPKVGSRPERDPIQNPKDRPEKQNANAHEVAIDGKSAQAMSHQAREIHLRFPSQAFGARGWHEAQGLA